MEATSRHGIIDSLSAGFAIVTRRPFLLVFPLLLDAVLSLAPGVSIKPVVHAAASWLTGTLFASSVSPEQLVAFKTQVESVARGVEGLNLLGVLSWQVPSLLGLAGTAEKESFFWTVSGGGQLLLFLAGLAVAGILVGCLYLGATAQAVLQSRIDVGALARGLVSSWGRLTGYLLLVVAGGVVLVVSFLFLMSLAALLGAGALALGSGLALGVVFLISVYLFLAKPAIFVGAQGPVQAVVHSARIATRSFWSVVGLFLLVNIITLGMGAIWRAASGSTVGLVIGMAGNAYIATGLAASVMVYYLDRSSSPQPKPSPSP